MVILGSQYVPGLIPSTPQAFPTIFCANVYPLSESSASSGLLKISVGSRSKASRVLSVSCLPMINGILPLALTSSRMTLVFNSNVVMTSLVFASNTLPLCGSRIIS